jgi:hypothetical protein
MIAFISGKKIPLDFIDYIDGNDKLKLITSSPMIGFITLTNISKLERQAFEDKLTIAYTKIEDIPFLLFKFGNILIFDAAFYTLEAKEDSENALNLILVENTNSLIIKSRVLGIKHEFISNLRNDINNLKLDENAFTKKVYEVQNKFSMEELFEKGKIFQEFSRV